MAERTHVLVLGAGLAGLGAMDELARARADYLCVEAAPEPGGLARTDVVAGYSFDQAGHFLHIGSPRFRAAIEASGVKMREHRRRASIFLGGTRIPFPIQFNLHAISPERRARVIRELDHNAALALPGPQNLAEALRGHWGPTLFEAFFKPFNEKLWRRPLEELPPDALGRYLPSFDRELVLRGAEGPIEGYGYNAVFLYPASGRIGDLPAALAQPHGSRLRVGVEALEVDLASRTCRTSHGTVRFDQMISTLPLPRLLTAVGRSAPPDLDFTAATVAVLCLGVTARPRDREHWVYVPDEAVPFHRVNFTASVGARPERGNGQSLLVEYGLAAGIQSLPDPKRAAHEALEWLVANGFVEACRLAVWHERVIRPAYVVHRQPGRAGYERLLAELESSGVRVAGRYGRWDYFSMEESFLSGAAAAQQALAAVPSNHRVDWPPTRE